MWVNCSQPSSDLIAQCSFLHFKIRKNLKWLFINLIAIVFLTSECSVLADTYSFILVLACWFSVCYYVVSSIVLYFRILKLELDFQTHDCNTVVSNRQAPSSLVRYFEDRGVTFLCRYWDYFYHILQNLRYFRLNRIGQNLELFRIESELRALEHNMKQRHVERAKKEEDFKDSLCRLDNWLKYDRKTLVGQAQLEKYWKEYLKATKNELVRYSTAQFSRGECIGQDAFYQERFCDVNKSNTSFQVSIPEIFSALQYQLSSDPDSSEIPRDAGSSSYADLFTAMRTQHKEKHFNPSLWVRNLRSWLSAKFNEVVQQFDAANGLLKSCGVTGVKIGTTDVSCLRSVFETHQLLKSYVPLLDFLTLSHDQVCTPFIPAILLGYLMWRYRVLASDGCMRHFSWNSGGAYRGTWNPAVSPNDSEVVLHFFSSYLDMKLPCYPSHSTCKRPFSDSYVLVGPNRKAPPYTNLAIFQQWVSPPHFNIIVEGNQLEMPRGNNNLFLAIGYLLYCIKTYHSGKIGRVSLGRHGLNILWIVGDSNHP